MVVAQHGPARYRSAAGLDARHAGAGGCGRRAGALYARHSEPGLWPAALPLDTCSPGAVHRPTTCCHMPRLRRPASNAHAGLPLDAARRPVPARPPAARPHPQVRLAGVVRPKRSAAPWRRARGGLGRARSAAPCSHPRRAPAPHAPRRVFQRVWARGEPIIVRGMAGEMGWTPEGLGRVCKEANKCGPAPRAGLRARAAPQRRGAPRRRGQGCSGRACMPPALGVSAGHPFAPTSPPRLVPAAGPC